MRIAASHFLCCVPDKGVDHSLVDAFEGTVTNERVTEHMPAFEYLPPGASKGPFQVIVGLVSGQRLRAIRLRLAKRVLPTWMLLEPSL